MSEPTTAELRQIMTDEMRRARIRSGVRMAVRLTVTAADAAIGVLFAAAGVQFLHTNVAVSCFAGVGMLACVGVVIVVFWRSSGRPRYRRHTPSL